MSILVMDGQAGDSVRNASNPLVLLELQMTCCRQRDQERR